MPQPFFCVGRMSVVERVGVQGYERHGALCICALLLALSYLSSRQPDISCYTGEYIEVEVVGAVVPKKLVVEKGTRVEEILAKVRLDKLADLQEILGSKKLTESGYIVVPWQGVKTIYVTGAVKEPKVVTLSGGGVGMQILEQVELSDRADRKALLRKKSCKNASVVEVRECCLQCGGLQVGAQK